MAVQLLFNRGFEEGLNHYITQGTVLIDEDVAYSGMKSAKLLSTPKAIAELSQVVFLVLPGIPVRFSFAARRFHSRDVNNPANVRAEVNFLNTFGIILPPGIVINIRGRDLGYIWNCYDGYGEAPSGTVAARVLIRLEPPGSGVGGLLVDDLALIAEVD